MFHHRSRLSFTQPPERDATDGHSQADDAYSPPQQATKSLSDLEHGPVEPLAPVSARPAAGDATTSGEAVAREASENADAAGAHPPLRLDAAAKTTEAGEGAQAEEEPEPEEDPVLAFLERSDTSGETASDPETPSPPPLETLILATPLPPQIKRYKDGFGAAQKIRTLDDAVAKEAQKTFDGLAGRLRLLRERAATRTRPTHR